MSFETVLTIIDKDEAKVKVSTGFSKSKNQRIIRDVYENISEFAQGQLYWYTPKAGKDYIEYTVDDSIFRSEVRSTYEDEGDVFDGSDYDKELWEEVVTFIKNEVKYAE